MAIIKKIQIKDEFITLGQFIKLINLISSGGEAKTFLMNSKIEINGVLDNRRGRKIYKNDQVIINNKVYKIC